ncbi:MAG TPA: glycosyl transferase, partial [Sulfurospirillum arcachonense]|nr:glycosyl transferase [Sulfurospirillum arcachonense]
MEKIDFVLPWVDNSDLSWQEDRAKHDMNHNAKDHSTETHFRDMHTLKYVLRSIEKHCPWYHQIYIITTGH